MRVIIFAAFLLVGCATNSVTDEDFANAVWFENPERATIVASNEWARQDMDSLKRSASIMRNLSKRLSRYEHK